MAEPFVYKACALIGEQRFRGFEKTFLKLEGCLPACASCSDSAGGGLP